MAFRPIFLASPSTNDHILEKNIEFEWMRGQSTMHKQKSIQNLHKAGHAVGIKSVLEVSSKSEDGLGVSLSAFNLCGIYDESEYPVECIYQSSKVFLNGGPFRDIVHFTPLEAKRDERLRQSGALINFEFDGLKWASQPTTAFYDWIYINAVVKHTKLLKKIEQYRAFTDIEFNPKKQINCQARSLAFLRSLMSKGMLDQVLQSPKIFLDQYPLVADQQGALNLFENVGPT